MEVSASYINNQRLHALAVQQKNEYSSDMYLTGIAVAGHALSCIGPAVFATILIGKPLPSWLISPPHRFLVIIFTSMISPPIFRFIGEIAWETKSHKRSLGWVCETLAALPVHDEASLDHLRKIAPLLPPLERQDLLKIASDEQKRTLL